MAGSILAYISGKIFFPNRRFVQEHSKLNKFSLQSKFREKLMTKFFFKFKKPHFWPTSPILWGEKYFPKKSGTHNLIRFSSTMLKFSET